MNIGDDEFAFLKYNDIIYASATPANAQASLEAKNNGKPFHKLITTTPGDLKTTQGVYAKKFFDNAATFDEKMYDWKKAEIEDYIAKNSINNFVYIEFSYKQLGRSEAWFQNQCRELNMDRFKINREILLQWNKSSDISPFTEEEIERLYDNVCDPVATLMLSKYYPLSIYKDFNWHKNLLIGVDVSGGLSKDYSAIVIIDPDTMEVVADFANNVIDSVDLASLLYDMVKKFFINSTLVIERNSYGKTVIDMLLKTDVQNRLYFEVKKTQAEKKITDVKRQKFETRVTRVYGVNTDAKTRPQMIDLLRVVINEEYTTIKSKRLVDDIAGLERKNNGKIEHGDVTHDDLLFAYLVVRWVWAYGTNLSHFFIYKKKKVTTENGEEIDAEQEYRNRFLSVANLNRKTENLGELTSQKIIEEWHARQKHIETEKDFTNVMENKQVQSFQSIFSMNFEKKAT
jgi:hypothetical protein